MGFSINEPPSFLPEASRGTWLHGMTGDPAVGDIWLLAWDDLAELCMVTADRDSYVLAWPVTLDLDKASSPAGVLPPGANPLGITLVIWTQAETGLGKHLLARRLGPAIDARHVYELRRSVNEDIGQDIIPRDWIVSERYPEGDLGQYLDELISKYQALCFHEWPATEPGDAVFDRWALQSRGVDPRIFGDILGISHPGQVTALWQAESSPTIEQIQRISEELHVDVDEILVAPESAEVDALRQPRFKADLIALSRKRNEPERVVRRAVLQDLTMAARRDLRGAEVENRVRSTLSKLLTE